MKAFCLLALIPALASAQESIERLDPALDAILDPDAKIETLCTGFDWAEGPVWDEKGQRLIFSDVPRNIAYQWKEGDTEASVFMKPSGYTGVAPYGSEPGSNGIAMDDKGQLYFCEHGDRRVSYLTPGGGKRTLADNFEGKRFNSPNDLAIAKNGDVYFTDPPYGMPGRENDKEFRELDFHGVYRVTPQGEVSLITKELDRPNGVALSPDGKTLYVAQSHGPAPIIMAYPLKDDGSAGEGKLFFNCKDLKGPGAPDGLKVDAKGNVFSTGPGGCLILSPEGKLLGRILCGRPTANVAFGEKGKRLYLTSDDRILRVALK
ncbi:SMP-30/gluconolactonase/LRE family protein [Luteolibacter flavescens]|uniref:SMP-30/gluconolactonase/LRE family protein n=1 Tax=Luteolibacter flavescens TaxID=1859460 RepID=A0ABT3FQJ6_9BACT|nr:SMP-30/gluconolactonase/LRE family protein [Luteolibacter flavescens]MCW1885852.1 SMP-30/gluconolactonase/LRE family protein [Luteolibacter flavescens]